MNRSGRKGLIYQALDTAQNEHQRTLPKTPIMAKGMPPPCVIVSQNRTSR